MSLEIKVDTYCAVVQADTYHANMGNSDWPETPETDGEEILAKKEAALRQATLFLDLIGRGKWKGTRATAEQSLAWPRTEVTDEDGYEIAEDAIPAALSSATCEAALRYYQGENLLYDVNPAIAAESVSGAVSVSYVGEKGDITDYRKIYSMLSGLVSGDISGTAHSGSVSVRRG